MRNKIFRNKSDRSRIPVPRCKARTPVCSRSEDHLPTVSGTSTLSDDPRPCTWRSLRTRREESKDLRDEKRKFRVQSKLHASHHFIYHFASIITESKLRSYLDTGCSDKRNSLDTRHQRGIRSRTPIPRISPRFCNPRPFCTTIYKSLRDRSARCSDNSNPWSRRGCKRFLCKLSPWRSPCSLGRRAQAISGRQLSRLDSV